MKQLSFGLFLCVMLLLVFTSQAHCAQSWDRIYLYDGLRIEALSNNEYRRDHSPQISNSGHVAWMGVSAAGTHVYLYDGNTTWTVSQGLASTLNGYHDINDEGIVVWANNGEVYMSDGWNRTNISSRPGRDGNPKINDYGMVVWYGCDTADCSNDGDYEIFLYDGTSTTQITDNSYDDYSPQINDNGWVVWRGSDGSDYEIFLYNGTNTTQLTNNDYDDSSPRLNSSGYVVWEGCDDVSEWGLCQGDFEIFLYDGTSTAQITNNDYDDQGHRINDSGYVVWYGGEGDAGAAEYEIYLYDGTTITQITDNDLYDREPEINDSGQIVWVGGAEIYLYDGTAITKVAEYSWGDYDPDINDDGMIVWNRYLTPLSVLWTPATVAGTEAASNPNRLNYIFAIFLPIGMIFLMRGLRRNRI